MNVGPDYAVKWDCGICMEIVVGLEYCTPVVQQLIIDLYNVVIPATSASDTLVPRPSA